MDISLVAKMKKYDEFISCYNEYNWTNPWEPVTDYTSDLTVTDETFSPLYGASRAAL